jgi:hypothetical protein
MGLGAYTSAILARDLGSHLGWASRPECFVAVLISWLWADGAAAHGDLFRPGLLCL